MFTKIGKKIKTVATVVFYVLALASIISGFYVIFGFGRLVGTGNAILLGILIALLGCLLAWLSSIMMYGYGELVDNSAIIKDQLLGNAPSEQAAPKSSPFNGLAKAVGNMRSARQSQPVQQQEVSAAPYQPPQTTPAFNPQNRQAAGYTQPTPYQRAGSYAPSQQQPASLTGKSGWAQVDAQNIQCPNCRFILPAAQAKRYGCCPQCRMPFNP